MGSVAIAAKLGGFCAKVPVQYMPNPLRFASSNRMLIWTFKRPINYRTRALCTSSFVSQIELRKKEGDVAPATKAEKAKQAVKDTSYGLIIVAGVSCMGFIFYVLYKELISKAGPTQVFGDALEKCRSHPELTVALGSPIEGYGEMNSRGRRRHVSHLAYIDSQGRDAMRMKFYIKGSSGRTGTVNVDSVIVGRKILYRYIIAYLDIYPRRIIIVLDERSETDKEAVSELGHQNMPVCKFYLQGNCRYGDRCYNEHPRHGNRRQEWHEGNYDERSWQRSSQGHRYKKGNTFNTGYNQSQTSRTNYNNQDEFRERRYQTQGRQNERGPKQDRYHWSRENRFGALAEEKKPDNDVNTMLATIQEDIKIWAGSKMWPFSCYSYTKEVGCIEGLPDISPEEMRVLACLHPSEYPNILSEIESTYCKVKDEIFEMNDAARSNLISQMNIVDSNPSENLKILTLYGPQFNFGNAIPPPAQSPASFAPQAPLSTGSVHITTGSLQGPGSTGSPFKPQDKISVASPAIGSPQSISVFGSPSQRHTKGSGEDEVYTAHDSLTNDEKLKFEADRFTIGEIPLRPPSEHYCR